MYKVVVLDNFHFMDPSEETVAGVYLARSAAIAKAERIVEGSLRALHRRGMTAKQIMEAWHSFGDNAVVVATGRSRPADFSGLDFAEKQAVEIAYEGGVCTTGIGNIPDYCFENDPVPERPQVTKEENKAATKLKSIGHYPAPDPIHNTGKVHPEDETEDEKFADDLLASWAVG
jgi:hypothetical protein